MSTLKNQNMDSTIADLNSKLAEAKIAMEAVSPVSKELNEALDSLNTTLRTTPEDLCSLSLKLDLILKEERVRVKSGVQSTEVETLREIMRDAVEMLGRFKEGVKKKRRAEKKLRKKKKMADLRQASELNKVTALLGGMDLQKEMTEKKTKKERQKEMHAMRKENKMRRRQEMAEAKEKTTQRGEAEAMVVES